MVRLSSSLNGLSVDQLRENYGQPDAIAITRIGGDPLPPNLPKEAVRPLFSGQKTIDMSLSDTQLVLADFGEAFAPASSMRLCEDSRSPLFARPPDARFEPRSPLTISAGVWSLVHRDLANCRHTVSVQRSVGYSQRRGRTAGGCAGSLAAQLAACMGAASTIL